MKKLLGIAMVAVALFGFTAKVEAQKIAHVNTQKVLELMPEYKQAQDLIQAKETEYMDELKIMETKLYKLEDEIVELQKNKEANATALKIKELDYKDLAKRYQTRQQEIQQSLVQLQSSLQGDLTKKIQDAIDKVAEAGGYTYVLDSQVLLYKNGGKDLTSEVIKALGITAPSTGTNTTTQP